jgi:hypothetical protein
VRRHEARGHARRRRPDGAGRLVQLERSGGRGADRINAGSGQDTVHGGRNSKGPENPASHDVIDCGAGEDTVFADPGDEISNCEHKFLRHPDNVEGDVRIGTGKLSGGVYALKLTCLLSDRCQGDVFLKTRGKVKLGKGKAKVQTLGRQKLSLAAGATLPVNIKLSKAGKKLVKKPGKLPAVASVELDAGLPSRQELTLP